MVDYNKDQKVKPVVGGESTVTTATPVAEAPLAPTPGPVFNALLTGLVQNKGISWMSANIGPNTMQTRVAELRAAEIAILAAYQKVGQ